MRNLLRKWLGINKIDEKVANLIAEVTGLSPEDVEEISKEMTNKRRDTINKMNNDHGTEGTL